jgi:hypothetical protein
MTPESVDGKARRLLAVGAVTIVECDDGSALAYVRGDSANYTVTYEHGSWSCDLFDAWRSWCDQVGERPGRRQDFGPALEEHGIVIEEHGHNRLTRGIGLLMSTGEHSSGTSPIRLSTGTLRTSAHESSMDVEEADRNAF